MILQQKWQAMKTRQVLHYIFFTQQFNLIMKPIVLKPPAFSCCNFSHQCIKITAKNYRKTRQTIFIVHTIHLATVNK